MVSTVSGSRVLTLPPQYGSLGMSVVLMHHTSTSLVAVAGIAPLHQVLALFVAPVIFAAQINLLLPHPVALLHCLWFAVSPFVVCSCSETSVFWLSISSASMVMLLWRPPHKFTFPFHVCFLMFKLLLSFFLCFVSDLSFFCPALSSLFFTQVCYRREGFRLLSLVWKGMPGLFWLNTT